MTIALGSDHAGYPLKTGLVEFLKKENIAYKDLGTYSEESVDYPDFGVKVGRAIAAGEFEWGVIMCGTGIGISISANKVPGVRAALCCNEYMAEMARRHNNAQIIAFGGRTTTPDMAFRMLKVFLNTEFDHGRHNNRVEKIHSLTGK